MNDPVRGAAGGLGEYTWTDRGGAGETRSATEVLKDIVGNVQEIIRSEVRLARAEIREETGKLMSASKMMLIGGVIGIYAAFFILLALVYGLAAAMAPWLAALIVGLGLAIVSGALLMSGRGRMKTASPKPEKTIHTVKENIEWMKDQTRS